MKKMIALLIAGLSFGAFAHEIEGTQVLKGSLKTEVRVNYIKTTCKVKVKEVKNLLEEDQFGNPAYKIEVEFSLTGGDWGSSNRIKHEKEVVLNNLFEDGVRDLEYRGAGYTLKIKDDGRLAQVTIPFGYNTVTCNF